MRRSRFSEAQVVANLREFDAGMPPRNSHDARTHANMIRLWRAPYTTCWWRTLVRYAAALDSSRAAVLNLSVQVALKMQISNLDPTQLCVIGVGCGEDSVAVRYQDRALAPNNGDPLGAPFA